MPLGFENLFPWQKKQAAQNGHTLQPVEHLYLLLVLLEPTDPNPMGLLAHVPVASTCKPLPWFFPLLSTHRQTEAAGQRLPREQPSAMTVVAGPMHQHPWVG